MASEHADTNPPIDIRARQARRHPESPSHNFFRRLTYGGLALLVLVAMITGALAARDLLAARHHLLRGAQELRSARTGINLASAWQDPGRRASLRRTLAAAEAEFDAAGANLAPWRPLTAHLGWVPLIGSQLAAAPEATDAARHATRAALDLLDGLSPVAATLGSRGPGSRGLPRLAASLQAGERDFVGARSEADRAAAALAHIPGHTGSASLDRAVSELRSRLPVLLSGSRWLAAAPGVVGMSGSRHYLVVLQNPAELRATGGFVGAADFITVRAGRIHSLFSGSAFNREVRSVPVPLPEAVYTPEVSWLFRDANWSPDFPLSARTIRWFYGEDTGRWADGVVGVVDTAIGRLLKVTGPVYLPSYGIQVTSSNVLSLAQRYRVSPYHGPSSAQHDARDTVSKQFLGYVVDALIARLQTLPANRLPALGAALADEVARRDLMIYDRRPSVEAAIESSAADGRLGPAPGDYLAIVDDNRSYNKINSYVRESASYQAVIRHDRSIDATLTLHYQVLPSPVELEGAGPGFGSRGSPHDYLDFLRVYVPSGTHLVSETGLEPWAPAPAYGLTQLAGGVQIREAHSRTVTLHYIVPADVFATDSSRYSLTVRRQPGTNLRHLQILVDGSGGVTVGEGSSAPARTTLSLAHDAVYTVPVQGGAEPTNARRSQMHAPLDPYLPFSAFHDPRHPL